MLITGTDEKGNLSTVNVENGRLAVMSVTKTEVSDAVDEGDAFTVYSGAVLLGDDLKTAVLYLKNNNAKAVKFTTLFVSSTPSTGGATDQVLVEQVGNIQPTDDIVVSGTEITANNRHAGKATQFVGVVKVGPNTNFSAPVVPTAVFGDFKTQQLVDLTSVIPAGGEIGLTVQASTGNSAQTVYLTIALHLAD